MNPAFQGNSLIIEASAGSGKTYQLINRLLLLLLSGANPAHIVAITFTRKAAAEMQVRLQERLYNLATIEVEQLNKELSNIGCTPTAKLISQARHLYEDVILSPQTVRCTTFHSFCQEILKRFPFEAEVPPGFELSEQTTIYRQQAWQALMSECELKENSNSSATKAIAFLFNEFGLNNTRDILKSFLDQRSDWWAWTQQAKNPVGLAISRMQDCLKVDPTADPLADFFNQPTLENSLAQFCTYLDKLKAEKFKKLLDALSYIRDTNLEQKERYQRLQTAFLTDKGQPRALKVSKEMIKLFGEAGADAFVQIHIETCSKLESLSNDLNLLNNYKINKHWYIAGEAFLNHYQSIKFSLRQLDFTDLEWQTYCLLTKSQHALWIQYKLDSRINHLLIDEFQDTNPIQWRLLQPLIEEFSQHEGNEVESIVGLNDSRSVLLVGDTKQSIYRFRRAEPKLFPIASNFIEQQFESERMQLNASWRSSPAIINFVNKVFGNTTLGKIITDFPEHKTELKNLPGSVTLLDYPVILDDDADEQETCFRNPLLQPRAEKQNVHQLEAENIATKITTLINNRQSVTISGETRNIQYQDIIILLRNRTNAAHYEKALHQHSIPFVGSERGTLLECLEVSDVIMLLNWLITPFNNVALVSILRSPLFSISDHTLIQLAQIHSKDIGNANWFNKIEILLSQQDPDAPLEPALKNALTLLKRWQKIAVQIPVHDLLDVIYNEADVLEQYHRAYPSHLKSRTRTNLTRLIELALEVDSGRYPSLQQFIAHIERIKNSADEAPDTPAASNDKNRVQVMTIHASKGLEAPVIFLANADAGSDNKDKYTYKTIIDWPAEQDTPNMMLLSNSSKRRDNVTASFIEKDSHAQQRETANLFYVAITRARQYLYVSAAKSTKDDSDWYSLIQKCYEVHSIDPDNINSDKTESEKTDSNETILEAHLLDAESQNISDTPSVTETQEYSAIIDGNLNKTIKINTTFQDIQKSVSPSNLSSNESTSETLVIGNDNSQTDTDATNRGIVIHSILEAICNSSDISKLDCQNKLGQDISERRWNEYWNEAISVVNDDKFSVFFSPRKPGSKYKAYNEVSISYLENNSTVYGIIDRIIVLDDTIHIIDYKTHQSVSSKNIQSYAEKYQPQLMHYQKAAQLIWPGHTIQSYLLFTHSNLLHEYTPSPAIQLQLI